MPCDKSLCKFEERQKARKRQRVNNRINSINFIFFKRVENLDILQLSLIERINTDPRTEVIFLIACHGFVIYDSIIGISQLLSTTNCTNCSGNIDVSRSDMTQISVRTLWINNFVRYFCEIQWGLIRFTSWTYLHTESIYGYSNRKRASHLHLSASTELWEKYRAYLSWKSSWNDIKKILRSFDLLKDGKRWKLSRYYSLIWYMYFELRLTI